jgi:hypothetical protein
MLAADKGGEIPDDPAVIQRLAMLEAKPDLARFSELGFVVLTPSRRQRDATVTPTGSQRDATVTPSRRQRDAPEAEAEAEESRGEKNITPSPLRGSGYSPGFDLFWSAALAHYKTAGCQPGTKAEAWSEWRKITDRNPSTWLDALRDHADAIRAGRASGDFVTPLKHLCRWLKHRGWEVEVVAPARRSVVEDGYAEGLRIAKMMGRSE